MKNRISILLSVFVLMLISMFAFNAYAEDTELIELNKSNAVITLGYTSVNYNGNGRTPTATVTYTDENGSEIKLNNKTDFNVKYENNINAGKATAVITGIGKYSGEIKENYTIKPLDISKKKYTEITLGYTSTIFSGKAKTPNIKLYWVNGDKKTLLVKDKDFTVKYSNNINIGDGSVAITGINNYSGSIKKTFKIVPKKVTGLKISSTSSNSVTVKWNKQNYISGYKIYRYDSNKKVYKSVGTVSAKNNSFTIKNLNPACANLIKVRAYKSINKSTNYYGDYSALVRGATKPAKVVLSDVGKSGKNKIKVSWNKVKASGYQLYYSTDKKFKKNVKSVVISNPKATSYTIKNVNNKKTYYVRVRAFYNYKDKKYIGSYSQYLSTYYNNLYATYYSYYESNSNRTTNLKIASKAISGTIIQPGQTFSFNKVVGPRTSKKGYKDAHVFSGDGVVDGIGGGICQVASTMFNCALRANVGIVERHQHTQRVAYVPLGIDAAIYGTAEDFKWKNTTKYPIKIVMTVKNGKISCSFYTCENAKPKKVSLKVSQKGKNFTLKRYAGGKVNYSCKSNY
ncbi:MAG: VanW family protein [Acetobacter sp.]|nr:VanW family protein [Bacteroides sp.]MCM1342192.1 VanW family protein [Acetobacter sp.]MCM1434410.1 VanW family protein [Clostridiales bacterium]